MRSVAVHLDEAADLNRLSMMATQLAKTLGAGLLGVATASLKTMVTGASLTLNLLEAQERELQQLLQRMESHFRAQAREVAVDWRSAVTDDPTGFVLDQAMLGDLLIAEHRSDQTPALSRVDFGRLVLGAGRPVLMLPPYQDNLEFDRVLIAYKPGREGRAAVQAALPLLHHSRRVLIAGVGGEVSASELDDVVHYLARHEIESEARHVEASAGAVSAVLTEVAAEDATQLLVSGAYGHSRTRERLFGGVTRDLLSSARLPCLLVH